MISNAKDTPLNANSGTVPNVSGAILNWFQPMTFTTTVQTIVGFQVVDTPTDISFFGVWQPFTAQQLAIKPQGERDWLWFTVHAQPGLILTPDQLITYLGVQYRVKEKLDYQLYGYIEYHLIDDYTGSGPG